MKRDKMATNSKITQLRIKKKKLNYFREVQIELKKVSWTTKTELISFTKIVLGSTFIFAMVIYLADVCIKNALNLINLISRVLFG